MQRLQYSYNRLKLLGNSSFGILFNSWVTHDFNAFNVLVTTIFHVQPIFHVNYEKRKKSHGVKSGEYPLTGQCDTRIEKDSKRRIF